MAALCFSNSYERTLPSGIFYPQVSESFQKSMRAVAEKDNVILVREVEKIPGRGKLY